MKATKARKPREVLSTKPAPSVAPAPPGKPQDGPTVSWLAANINGHLRGIVSALDDLANGAHFAHDDDGWLMEVLIKALEREADRLEEVERRASVLERGAA